MNQCKVCLKSYVWPQDLQRHIKLKHPIKEKGDTENLHHQQTYTVFFPAAEAAAVAATAAAAAIFHVYPTAAKHFKQLSTRDSCVRAGDV